MDFTFGIITDGSKPHYVQTIIDAIEAEEIPSYEVIVIGGKKLERKNTIFIPFDESQRPLPWVTKKKNMISNLAEYDNVVYMYDYVTIMSGFYSGFLQFGNDWDLCMTRILNNNGKRFRDWVCWDNPDFREESHNGTGQVLAPYCYEDTTHMYISGTYWVGKKKFMMKNPLNEKLTLHQAEDLEWSFRVRNHWNYKMNTLSSVYLLRQKHMDWNHV